MIYPSIAQLTQNKYNRYTLVIATAICARKITDLVNNEKDKSEKAAQRNDTNYKVPINREILDQKPVKSAINGLYNGDYVIVEKDNEEVE